MGDFEPRTRKSSSKIRPFAARQSYTYNSSSLAVDLLDSDAEEADELYLVPARPIPMPSSVPTFGNLDTALRQRSPKSRIISAIVHAVLIGLLLWLGMQIRTVVVPAVTTTHVDFKLFAPPPPPKILPVAAKTGGGGGGGAHQIVEPTKGRAPEVAKVQLNAPQLARLEHPKLAVEPTTPIKIPDDPKMMNLGAPDIAPDQAGFPRQRQRFGIWAWARRWSRCRSWHRRRPGKRWRIRGRSDERGRRSERSSGHSFSPTRVLRPGAAGEFSGDRGSAVDCRRKWQSAKRPRHAASGHGPR